MPVDVELARAMKLPFDSRAHVREHSAEVLIPFLQYFLSDSAFSIVPVCMLDQSFISANHIAERIIEARKKTGRRIMLLASCDFSHFLPPAEGAHMDQMVIDHILQGNTAEVERVVRENRISVCGYGPIMTLMEYSRSLSSVYKTEILARGHSGEVSPSPEVVDYVSLITYK